MREGGTEEEETTKKEEPCFYESKKEIKETYVVEEPITMLSLSSDTTTLSIGLAQQPF